MWLNPQSAHSRKSLLEDLSSGRLDSLTPPPPSASGAGGIMHQQACSDHFSISLSDSQLRAPPERHLRISVPRSIHSPAPVTPAAQLTHCAQSSTVFSHYAAAALQQGRAPPIQATSCKCDAHSSKRSLHTT